MVGRPQCLTPSVLLPCGLPFLPGTDSATFVYSQVAPWGIMTGHTVIEDILLVEWHVLSLVTLPCRYADSLDSHLQSLVLRHMPSNLQKLDRSKAGRMVQKRGGGWARKEAGHV